MLESQVTLLIHLTKFFYSPKKNNFVNRPNIGALFTVPRGHQFNLSYFAIAAFVNFRNAGDRPHVSFRLSSTRSPSLRLVDSEYHFFLGCNKGGNSLFQRSQKTLAKY